MLSNVVAHESIPVDTLSNRTHIFSYPGTGSSSFSGRVYALQAVSGVQDDDKINSVVQTYRDAFGYELVYENSQI